MTTIAVCSERGAPDDRHTWSGTPLHLIEALRDLGVDVVPIGPLGSWRRWSLQRWAGLTGRLGRRMNWEVEPLALRFMGRCLVRELKGHRVDAVITMGWYPLLTPDERAALPPVYYFGDAPMALRLDNSPFWSGLSKRTHRIAVAQERRALRSIAGVFMSSQWACKGLVESEAIEPDRVRQVPFGANVPDPGVIERGQPTGHVRLLSVGVHWHRKGLDLAVHATERLRERGIDCSLDVVGTDPPDASWDRPFVRYHGFIAASTPEGVERLARLYREADIFLLPTRYEPFGIVLSEAHAYSLPVVATAVNGITERIVDQGVLVAEGAPADAFADGVQEALSRYDELCRGARAAYLHDANWAQSAARILSALQEMPR